MIIATIQNSILNAEQIVALDGKVLSGDERQECLSKFVKDTFDVEIEDDKEDCFFINDNQLFCYMYHPQNDEIDRRRRAMILFDKNTSEKECEKTIEIMGLVLENFNVLKEKVLPKIAEKGNKSNWLVKLLKSVVEILGKFFKGGT